MATGKKLEDIIKELERFQKNGNKEESKQAGELLQAFYDLQEERIDPNSAEYKKGGTISTFQVPTKPQEETTEENLEEQTPETATAIVSTPKGTGISSLYPAEVVDNFASVLAEQIALNGANAKEPDNARKKSNSLKGVAVALITATIVLAGVSACAHFNNSRNNQGNANIKQDTAIGQVVETEEQSMESENTPETQEQLAETEEQPAETKEELNFKNHLESSLRYVLMDYNNLDAYFNKIKGSEELKQIDNYVKKHTGFESLEAYKNNMKKEHDEAKKLCEEKSNDNLENNDEFRTAYFHIQEQDFRETLEGIYGEGFKAFVGTYTPSNTSSSDLEMGE